METFKAVGVELEGLKAAAAKLKAANATMAEAKKSADAAKQHISDWLGTFRKVDIDALKIGERVLISEVVMVSIGKQNKFDAKAFEMEEPKLFAQFKRDFATKQFEPLV
jgi:hypothetical protein